MNEDILICGLKYLCQIKLVYHISIFPQWCSVNMSFSETAEDSLFWKVWKQTCSILVTVGLWALQFTFLPLGSSICKMWSKVCWIFKTSTRFHSHIGSYFCRQNTKPDLFSCITLYPVLHSLWNLVNKPLHSSGICNCLKVNFVSTVRRLQFELYCYWSNIYSSL